MEIEKKLLYTFILFFLMFNFLMFFRYGYYYTSNIEILDTNTVGEPIPLYRLDSITIYKKKIINVYDINWFAKILLTEVALVPISFGLTYIIWANIYYKKIKLEVD